MKTSDFYKVVFVALFCAICGVASAQNNGTWKKKVGRVIDLSEKENDVTHHNKDAKPKPTLLEMMADDIKSGKLDAYSTFDCSFTTKLSAAELKNMTTSKVDTIVVVDPVTGKEMTKLVRKDCDYSAIHKYRILEEWTFDPHTGRTEIQITGIAPIREIYNEDGAFRGVQAMFWVKYNDARSIIAGYEQYNPGNTIAGHIWHDYFSNDSATGEVWKKKAVRLVDFAQKDDNISHHLTDAREDTSIYKMIATAIKSGKLGAYASDDNNMASKISYEALKEKRWGTPDTIVVVDPVTNQQTWEIHDLIFEYYTINKYRILEEWAFDPHIGKTEIQIRGIGPTIDVQHDESGSETQLMFWLRYNDIQDIASRYEQYHPDNTLAGHVWHDYFLSDVKPELVK